MDLIKLFIWILFGIALVINLTQQQVVNVAVGKPADQHTILNYAGFEWTADKAVDGRLERDDPNTQESCSASVVSSGQETANYWRVNLTRLYEVVTIYIYPRTDQEDNQLEGFNLYIADANGQEEQITDGPSFENSIYTYQFSPAKSVTEVIIRRPSSIIIINCETQVFAVCDGGFFGYNCSRTCGRCLNNTACDKTTGACPGGCKDGYYSQNCMLQCGNCFKGEACNTVSGTCPNGCEEGWKENTCTKVCDDGFFGHNCSRTCGRCLNNIACDKTTGSCPGGCKAGYYSQNCMLQCGNCLNGEACDTVSGTCPNGCEEGWKENTCTKEISGMQCDSGSKTVEYILAGIIACLCVVIIVGITQRVFEKRKERQKARNINYLNAVSINDGKPSQRAVDEAGYYSIKDS